MKQIIVHGSSGVPGVTGWTGFGGDLDSAVEVSAKTPWGVAGTFRNLYIKLTGAPGSGAGWTIEVYKGGVATGMVVSIFGSSVDGWFTASDVTVSPGDELALLWTTTGTPGAAGVAYYSVEFEGDNANESGYAQMPATAINRRTGVFWPVKSSGIWTLTAGNAMENVVPTGGDLKALYYRLDGAPGAGTSYHFHVYKNGVKQDGSGGTVNTTVTISDAATSGNASFTLALVATDRVYIECSVSGSPAGRAVGVAARFLATTDGESIMGGWSTLDQSTPIFHRFHGATNTGAVAETTQFAPASVATFGIAKLRVRVYTAPGVGKSQAFVVRKNGAATSFAATVSDAANDASDLVDSVSLSNGDRFSASMTPSGTPAASTGTWSAVQTMAADEIKTSFVVGVNGEVQSTQTLLVNLDGTSRTVDMPRTMVVGAPIAMAELSTPPTGVAGYAIMFTEDNGSGKLRTLIQFPTGAAQQIAIEP